MKETKEHILEVAFMLFLQNSYKGVTMNDIVKNSKISKGAFYHYFESKEQLFLEVLNHILIDSFAVDFSRLSYKSMYQFFHDFIDELKKIFTNTKKNTILSINDANFFFLIFEGIRMFPEYRKSLFKYQEHELNAWLKIIKIAREKKEIRSTMTDEQIARSFIYISDGIGMKLIMGGKLELMGTELFEIWNSFYKQLKA